MSLIEKINGDLKAAMKGSQADRVGVLRFVLAGLQNAQKDKNVKQPGAALTDEEAVTVLQKEVKRRKEAIELFKKGNRNDLVQKEEAELAVILAYVPAGLSEEEVGVMVDELRVKGFNDFNSLMREAMKLAKGRADGKMVGEVVKKKLG